MEEWLEQLCSGLDRSRWRPVVALVRGLRAHDPDRFRAAHPNLETVEIDGRGFPGESRVREVMRVVRRVAPAVFVPLVVADAHVAAARLRASRRSPRYLLTLHGNTAPQLLDARELVPYADLAVGPGRLTCALLRSLGMPADRLRHIPNGARVPSTEAQPRELRRPLRLGYVGRLTPGDKRVGDLVPLVQELTRRQVEFEFTVAGDGPERDRLQSALAAYPVRFLGACTPDQLYREVYPNLDLLMLFSESEAFGIALVEAMQHGVVPVTAAYLGSRAEGLVIDGDNGAMFPVGDSMAAAEAVQRLANSPDHFHACSLAALARVRGRYTWANCIQAWDTALSDCLESPLRPVPESPQPRRSRSSMLDRLGVPVACVDAVRRARRAMFGVPASMSGGEEWPWVGTGRSAEDLEAMVRLRLSLDVAAGADAAHA